MKKILIVDDQAAIRDLVATTLRMGPFQILRAGSGSEALDLAQREQPDLILLDVMMPEGKPDGLEVCRRLKTNAATRHCFVVMLSALNQKSDIEEGFAAGANDYLVKPFSPLELMMKVDEVLGT